MKNHVTARLAAGVLVLLAAGIGALAAGPAAADGDAQRQFDQLFGREVKQVKATASTRDDAELAAQVLAAAGKAERPSPLRTLLYRKAYELGMAHPAGYDAAAEAMRRLGAEVTQCQAECDQKLLDVLQRQYAMSTGGASAKYKAGTELLDLLMKVARGQGVRGEWADAEATYRRALGVATGLRSSRRAEVMRGIQEARDGRAEAAKIDLLRERLKKDPSDTAARTELIRYWVAVRDEPAEAAALLSPGVEEALRTYVPLAAKPIQDVPPRACGELAMWYEGLLADAPSTTRAALLRRVRDYCRRCLDKAKPEAAAAIKMKMMLEKVQAELTALAVKPDREVPLAGAVLVLTFNEDTFADKNGRQWVRDLSGLGNDGLVLGAKPIKGQAGGGVAFDGQDARIVVGGSRSMETTGDQTVSLWVWPERMQDRCVICGKSCTGEGGLLLTADGRVAYYFGPGLDSRYTAVDCEQKIPRRKWSHLVVVRDMRRKQGRWYVNGKFAQGTPDLEYTRIRATRTDFTIGKGKHPWAPSEPFRGRLDELVVYARALSGEEVQMLFDVGRRGKSVR